MTTYVLDASAAARLVIEGPETNAIQALVDTADEIIAPTLFSIEIANTMWKYARAKLISAGQASANLDTVLKFVDKLIDTRPDIIREAMTEAIRANHPIYDMLYVIVARRRGAGLITIDKRLATLATTLGVPTTPPLT